MRVEGWLLAVSFAGGFAGCGGDVKIPAGTAVAYTHFGDSVTCGVGASAPANGYAALMDTTVRGPNANFCHSGDMAADTALLVYAHANPTATGTPTFTDMTGTNDVWFCGPSAGCVQNYAEALLAGFAWLAIPAENKLLAQQAKTRTGTWANDDRVRPGMGLASSVAGSSVTMSPVQQVAGRQMYVAWRGTDGSAAGATLAIDGKVVDTLHGYADGGVPIQTAHGVTTTVFVRTYPMGAPGAHTVTVTVQPGAPAGDAFTLLWCGVPSGTGTGPHLIAGGILSEDNGLRSGTTALYDGVVQTVVNGLKADGLDVSFAATHTVLLSPEDFTDTLHPNDAGHRKVEQAFLAAH